MAVDSGWISNFGILSLVCNFIIIEANVYTQNQFDLDNGKIPQFVMFHAPWCGHCKRLRPLWNLVEEHFASNSLPIKIANVDCTQDTPFCVREKIKAYPTIRLYVKNYVGDTYRGKRKLEALIEFAKDGITNKPESKEAAPRIIELEESTFYSHISTGLHFVDFFAPWCKHCKDLSPTWLRLADERVPGITIAQVNCVNNEKLCKEQGISAYPSLYVYHRSMKAQETLPYDKIHLSQNNWGTQVEDYSGDRSFGQLKSYVSRLIAKYDPLTVPNVDSMAANPDVPLEMPTLRDTLVLHEGNFLETIGEHENTFTMFYIEGCTGCDVFFPIWNDLARTVVEEERTFRIAVVDCTPQFMLCQRYKVEEYPKLIHFRKNGVGEIYFGGLTYDAIYRYIRHREKDEL